MCITSLIFLGILILRPSFAEPVAVPVPDRVIGPRDSTCTPTPVAHPKKHAHCNVQGYVKNGKYIAHFQSCTGDYVGCYESCFSDSSCVSFSYRASTNSCNTFSKPVNQQGFTSSATTGINFWNRNLCFTPASCSISCIPPTCGNQGLQWAVYPNNQGSNVDPTYSQFDPTIYKTEVPEFNSTTTTIGGIDYTGPEAQISVYGSSYMFNSDFFVLNHRGYLFAPQDGTYKINVTSADDIAEVWIGSLAYSGWTRPNANLDAPYDTAEQAGGSGSYQFAASQGAYTPVRIVFGQAQGAASFEISLTQPDGTVLLDSQSPASPYIVQYSCDGTSAPAYPPFGQET